MPVIPARYDGGGGQTKQDWFSLPVEEQWRRAGYEVQWEPGWEGSALTAPRGLQPAPPAPAPPTPAPWMPTIWKGPGAPRREVAKPWMQRVDDWGRAFELAPEYQRRAPPTWFRTPEEFAQYVTPEALQQRIFTDYGFTPEARRLLTTVPTQDFRRRYIAERLGPEVAAEYEPFIQREPRPVLFDVADVLTATGGGQWMPEHGRILLRGSAPEAALHEMTHAWADMTNFYDAEGRNLAFRGAVRRLAEETGPQYARAAELARGYEYGVGDWPGLGENDPERFAGLASGVMGDISQLPPYVRKFYEPLFTGVKPPDLPPLPKGPPLTRLPALPEEPPRPRVYPGVPGAPEEARRVEEPLSERLKRVVGAPAEFLGTPMGGIPFIGEKAILGPETGIQRLTRAGWVWPRILGMPMAAGEMGVGPEAREEFLETLPPEARVPIRSWEDLQKAWGALAPIAREEPERLIPEVAREAWARAPETYHRRVPLAARMGFIFLEPAEMVQGKLMTMATVGPWNSYKLWRTSKALTAAGKIDDATKLKQAVYQTGIASREAGQLIKTVDRYVKPVAEKYADDFVREARKLGSLYVARPQKWRGIADEVASGIKRIREAPGLWLYRKLPRFRIKTPGTIAAQTANDSFDVIATVISGKSPGAAADALMALRNNPDELATTAPIVLSEAGREATALLRTHQAPERLMEAAGRAVTTGDWAPIAKFLNAATGQLIPAPRLNPVQRGLMALKGVLVRPWMGMNPAYRVRNWVGALIHNLADGYAPFERTKDLTRFYETWGYTPPKAMQAITRIEAPIPEIAGKGLKDKLDAVSTYFLRGAQRDEAWWGIRSYTSGLRRTWNSVWPYWKPGIPDDILSGLSGAQGGKLQTLLDNGINPQQIRAGLDQVLGPEGYRLQDLTDLRLLDDGWTADQVQDLLGRAKTLDEFDTGLDDILREFDDYAVRAKELSTPLDDVVKRGLRKTTVAEIPADELPSAMRLDLKITANRQARDQAARMVWDRAFEGGKPADEILANLYGLDTTIRGHALYTRGAVDEMRDKALGGEIPWQEYFIFADQRWNEHAGFVVDQYDVTWRWLGGDPNQGPMASLQPVWTVPAQRTVMEPWADADLVGRVANKVGLQLEGPHAIRRFKQIDEALALQAKGEDLAHVLELDKKGRKALLAKYGIPSSEITRWKQLPGRVGEELYYRALLDDAIRKGVELPEWATRAEIAAAKAAPVSVSAKLETQLVDVASAPFIGKKYVPAEQAQAVVDDLVLLGRKKLADGIEPDDVMAYIRREAEHSAQVKDALFGDIEWARRLSGEGPGVWSGMGAPEDIGQIARRAGIDPETAGREEWQRALDYTNDELTYHRMRSDKEGIDSLVETAAARQPEQAILFGETRVVRKGRMGAKARKAYRDGLKPADMTWPQFYKQNKAQAGKYGDLVDELEGILEAAPPVPAVAAPEAARVMATSVQIDPADVKKGYKPATVGVGDRVRLVGEPVDVGLVHEVKGIRIFKEIKQFKLTTKRAPLEGEWVTGPFAEIERIAPAARVPGTLAERIAAGDPEAITQRIKVIEDFFDTQLRERRHVSQGLRVELEDELARLKTMIGGPVSEKAQVRAEWRRLWHDYTYYQQMAAPKSKLAEIKNKMTELEAKAEAAGYSILDLVDDLYDAPIPDIAEGTDRTIAALKAGIEKLRIKVRDEWGEAAEPGMINRAIIEEWITREVEPAMTTARMLALKGGEAQRRFTMLDYMDRSNMDTLLGYGYTFPFYQTHTNINWMQRMARNPAIAAAHDMYYDYLDELNQDVPLGYQNTIPITLPLFGEVRAAPQYLLDPMNALVWTQRELDRAETPREKLQALALGWASPWPGIEQGLAALGIYEPATWWQEKQLAYWDQFLGPLSRFVRGSTALMRQVIPGADEVIPAGGVRAEAALWRAAGKLFTGEAPETTPFDDPWAPSHVGKAVVALQLCGDITAKEANDALYKQKGGIWEEAKQLAGLYEGGADLNSYLDGLRIRKMLPSEMVIFQAEKEYDEGVGFKGEEWTEFINDFKLKYPWWFAYRRRYSDEEQRDVSQQTDVWWRVTEEMQALRNEHDAKRPTGAPATEGDVEGLIAAYEERGWLPSEAATELRGQIGDITSWDVFNVTRDQLNATYPKADIYWSPTHKSQEELDVHTVTSLMRRLTDSEPFYQDYDDFDEYMDAYELWGKGLPAMAQELWSGEVFKRYAGWANLDGVQRYHRMNDTATDALNTVWRDYYQGPYYDAITAVKATGKKGQLERRKIREKFGIPTDDELIAWVNEEYPGRFAQQELEDALEAGVLSIDERQAMTQTPMEREASEVWDILNSIPPGKSEEFRDLMGKQGDYLDMWYDSGGNPEAYRKWEPFYWAVKGAAEDMQLEPPEMAELEKWARAQDIKDYYYGVSEGAQLGIRKAVGAPKLGEGREFANFSRWINSLSAEEIDRIYDKLPAGWEAELEPAAREALPAVGVPTQIGGRWADEVRAAAETHDIDPRIIAAIIQLESGGNPEAVNQISGAMGLMQVMPGEKIEGRPLAESLRDPTTNIEAGTAILAGMLQQTDGDLEQALYLYSGGDAWPSYERYKQAYWQPFTAALEGLGEMGEIPELGVAGREGEMASAQMREYQELPQEARSEYWDAHPLLEKYFGDSDSPKSLFWDVYFGQLPPGRITSEIRDDPLIAAVVDRGVRGWLTDEAYTEAHARLLAWIQEHPDVVSIGNPEEWEQVRVITSQYWDLRNAGRIDEARGLWDANKALLDKYYPPTEYAPRARGTGGWTRRPRARTQEEILTETAKDWRDFSETIEDKGLLELIQSWLLLTPSQRSAFLRRHPELAAWLEGKDTEFLTELRESLAAHLSLTGGAGRRAAYRRRPPTLRWYRSWD